MCFLFLCCQETITQYVFSLSLLSRDNYSVCVLSFFAVKRQLLSMYSLFLCYQETITQYVFSLSLLSRDNYSVCVFSFFAVKRQLLSMCSLFLCCQETITQYVFSLSLLSRDNYSVCIPSFFAIKRQLLSMCSLFLCYQETITQYVFSLSLLSRDNYSVCVLSFFVNSFLAGLVKMVECEDERTSVARNLPHLLWLLRDVDLILADRSGAPITATEYVCSELKKPSISLAGSSLLHHFPSLHCITLPCPSSDGNLLSDIVTSRDKLTPAFKDKLQSAVQYILNNVRGKQGYNSSVKFDGNLLACLIRQCYKIFGESCNDLPRLHMSWSVVVETTFKKKAMALVNDYEAGLRQQLDGKLPINDGDTGETGETLMNIHLQVLAKKRLELQKDIVCYQPCLPSNCPSALERDVISAFDDSVAKYDALQLGRVVGGRLFFFLKENMKASEDFCTALYRKKYDRIVHSKLPSILSSQVPEPINEELSRSVKEYNSEARGPAISKVFKSLRKESSRLEAELELIPGPVAELKVVGVDADRVKLRLKKLDINPSAAERYDVHLKSKNMCWQVVSSSSGYSALVTGLKCSK